MCIHFWILLSSSILFFIFCDSLYPVKEIEDMEANLIHVINIGSWSRKFIQTPLYLEGF